MSVIEIDGLTKDYGNQKGLFDVSFTIEKGEILGFLGPNGSGKTTLIRHLMGFIKPDQGSVSVMNLDCFAQSPKIQEMVGYLPGEIAFMDEMRGIDFIKFIAEMKKIKDLTRAKELIEFLELDPTNRIKRMSKGMKQKIGLVIAFMQDCPILILDEPTSGLDPLMQNKFVELIKRAKAEGKTVLMSSHIFEEIENTCDRVVMIKDGKIVASKEMALLKKDRHKCYEISFNNLEDAISFNQLFPNGKLKDKTVTLIMQGQINDILKSLTQYSIDDISIRAQSLEELFLHYYGGGN